MTRSSFFVVLAAAGSLFAASTALADNHLVGTWTAVEEGSAGGIRTGTPSDEDHDDGEGSYLGYVPYAEGFTVTIDEMKGRAFSGQACSSDHCEDIDGTISNGGTIYMVDADGIVIGEMDGETAMELCYLEPGADFRVVMCGIYIKTE